MTCNTENVSNTPTLTPTISKNSQNRLQKRPRRSTDNTLSAINQLQNICSSVNENLKEDEFDAYGKYVASQLRSMSITRAITTQCELNNILSKARIEDITERNRGHTPASSDRISTSDNLSDQPNCIEDSYSPGDQATCIDDSSFSPSWAVSRQETPPYSLNLHYSELPQAQHQTSSILAEAVRSILDT